ncbi:MAG TPA: MXAN_5187 C-terminal domain-containing protein [Thermoanaerobaculia bacterium]
MIKQDDELDKLEEDIRILKNKYDQFFAGIVKVPPHFDRQAVERYIHELNKQKIRDNSRRFRLSTLVSRYNQYREMWARRMREREEGPLDFRRRQAALEGPAPERHEPQPPAHLSVTSSPADPYVRMTPGANGEQIRRLHAEVERANAQMGKINSVTVEQLAAMVQKQTELVRSKYHVNTVAFRVDTVDGKVKLKAKPLQD